MSNKAKPDDPAQSQRFIDMAHEVDSVDITVESFELSFQKVTNTKLPPKKKNLED